MDRRAKKLERSRKKREQTKKKAKALAARRPSSLELLARSAARGEFGPCFVSAEWDSTEVPVLVNLIVTRKLSAGQFVPGVVLVDRTCLGIKNGFLQEAMFADELDALVEQVGSACGGMLRCDPLVAQSIVFHAIDYARALGFEPHRDFPAMLFGPRPEQLVDTPWHKSERPMYIAGPYDDVAAIMDRLTRAVGAGNFHFFSPFYDDDDEDDEDDGEDVGYSDDVELVRSPLSATVSRDGIAVRIAIYRGSSEPGWSLEVEDAEGGSTVWDELFETDQAAFDAAMQVIEEEGIGSFAASSSAGSSDGPA